MLNYNNKAFIQFSQYLDFQTGHFHENNSNFDQNVAFFYLGTLALNIKPSAFGKKSFRIKVLIYMSTNSSSSNFGFLVSFKTH